MDGGGIFLSYRRDDTAGEAGRLAEHLARRFGQDRVFIDIDTIAPGTDFTTELERALVGTTVVLVIIGRRWLTAADAQGRRRLDVSDDFVRREILTALQRGTRLIPVLVQNATMPTAADLPDALGPLASRQAMAIQHEEFGADAQRLADAIAPLLEPSGTRPETEPCRGRSDRGRGVARRWSSWGGAGNGPRLRPRQRREPPNRRRPLGRHASRKWMTSCVWRMRSANEDNCRTRLTTLERAVSLDADTSRAKALEEDVAMQWIRDLAVESGQRFADAMKTPLGRPRPCRAVCQRPAAGRPPRAPRLGHVPALARRRAIPRPDRRPIAKPWPSIRRTPMRTRCSGTGPSRTTIVPTTSNRHGVSFARPSTPGAQRTSVRGLQLSALRNVGSVDNRLETIRVLDEMRRRDERLRPRDVSDAWSIYYFALSDSGALTSAALLAVLPPTEHLLTLRWAFDEYARSEKSRLLQMRYYTARLRAEAGNVMAARDALQALRTDLDSSPGSLRDAVDRALKALPARPRQQPRLPPRRLSIERSSLDPSPSTVVLFPQRLPGCEPLFSWLAHLLVTGLRPFRRACRGAARRKPMLQHIRTPDTSSRVGRFALVGLGGLVIQMIVLDLLTRVAALDYRAATVLAVEAAVLHNFVWHERWTWRVPKGAGSRLTRAVRFHSTTAVLSIVGNVVLMSLFVEALGWPVLLGESRRRGDSGHRELSRGRPLGISRMQVRDFSWPDHPGRTSHRVAAMPESPLRRGRSLADDRWTRLRRSSNRNRRGLDPLRGDDRAAYRCRTRRRTPLPRDGFRDRSRSQRIGAGCRTDTR